MEISYDREADALYIRLGRGGFARNRRLDSQTILDIDEKGRIVGIEFLDISKRVPAQAFTEVHLKNLALADSS